MKPVYVRSVSVYTQSRDINHLCGILAGYWDFNYPVILDFSLCSFISAEGVALLSCFFFYRKSHSLLTLVNGTTVPRNVLIQLQRWQLPGLPEHRVPKKNAVPLLHLNSVNIESVRAYLDQHLIPGVNLPWMTAVLRIEIVNSIFELLDNVFMHSHSKSGAIIVGQHYPTMKQLQFCICDGGVGIAAKVRPRCSLTNDVSCIRWSLGEGNTTKEAVSDPGGLGLHLLRQMVLKNKGNFEIYANRGFYSESAGKTSSHQQTNEFRGTLIQVRLHIRDNEIYDLVKPSALL